MKTGLFIVSMVFSMPAVEDANASQERFSCQSDLYSVALSDGNFSVGGYGLAAHFRAAFPEGSVGIFASTLPDSECAISDNAVTCNFRNRIFESSPVNGPKQVLIEQLNLQIESNLLYLNIRTEEGMDSIESVTCNVRTPDHISDEPNREQRKVVDLEDCGNTGTLSERMAECSEANAVNATVVIGEHEWNLVAVTINHAELWLDHTGVLFGQTL